MLALGSVFPLPERLVSAFIDGMEEVAVVEGSHPAIEVQVRGRQRVDGRLRRGEAIVSSPIPEDPEELFGLSVVRDRLGPASAINLAHGMAKGGRKKILALTDAELLSPFGPSRVRQHALQRVRLPPRHKNEGKN